MKPTIPLIITLPLLALFTPACDSPDDEAELQALDEADLHTLDDQVPDAEREKEALQVDEFDLESASTPQAGPPGKCCKAMCSWDPGHYRQLPYPLDKADNCNANAEWYCKNYGPYEQWQMHLEDAQWRTCG